MAYKTEDFIKAIPGTGGVISAIADKVGCTWHTANKYCQEYATVHEVWKAEKSRVTDKARSNVIAAIVNKDLQTSKWWLATLDPEFKPKQEIDHTGGVKYTIKWEDDEGV